MSDALTPYDTGAVLEPKGWVDADGIAGSELRRPAEADDYGKVDFDDDEGNTVTTVRIVARDGVHILQVMEPLYGSLSVEMVSTFDTPRKEG